MSDIGALELVQQFHKSPAAKVSDGLVKLQNQLMFPVYTAARMTELKTQTMLDRLATPGFRNLLRKAPLALGLASIPTLLKVGTAAAGDPSVPTPTPDWVEKVRQVGESGAPGEVVKMVPTSIAPYGSETSGGLTDLAGKARSDVANLLQSPDQFAQAVATQFNNTVNWATHNPVYALVAGGVVVVLGIKFIKGKPDSTRIVRSGLQRP